MKRDVHFYGSKASVVQFSWNDDMVSTSSCVATDEPVNSHKNPSRDQVSKGFATTQTLNSEP